MRFETAASGVEVRVNGARGLVLNDGDKSLVSGVDVVAGQVLTFDVGFKPGPGESLLAVVVKGQFGGREQMAVQAFPIGVAGQAPATTEVGGHEVRLMPASSK